MDQLPSYVTCGDIDIVGDKLTVECMFNKIPNSLTPHLVTKHSTANNVNYALGPSYAEINTASNGYVILQSPCKPDSMKTYHVAMVYDGATLKFYSDGYLMASTPCSGALANNNILTTIGQINAGAGPMFEQHKGYINEVRIWNVARTQAQIRANMNSSLPSPATQPGLQGYYIFNDLLNKQGNPAYNATLGGTASINRTNPQCAFTADSCKTCISPLQVTINGNKQICTGSSTTLTASGAGAFDSVRWSTNATTTTISVSQGGNYSVTVYKNGCRGDTFAAVTQKSCSVDTFTICKGDSVLLTGPIGYQHYRWTPSTGLSNDTLQSPKASPNSTTKYVVTGSNLGAVDTTEILKNGSFANNLQFWGTDLFALTPSCTSCNGWYDLTKTTWCNTPDHTPTDSILFQSSPTLDTSLRVLYQTITVKPNTTYSFSAWGMALTYNPAIFHVTINNDVVVNNFTLNTTACTGWGKFTGTWFSGSNTTATLVIKDYMPDDNGNDFDLDDISLKEVAASGQVTDTFVVIVNPKPVSFTLPNDTTICGPVLKTLSTGNPVTVWSTGITASQITVNQPGKYWATVSNSCGTVSDTINITQSAGLNFSFGGNTSVCRGSSINLDAGSGYTGYLWSSGETTQSITITNPGKYWAQVSKNGCTGSDTIQVTQLDKPPVFSLGKDTVYCDTFTRVLSSGFTQTTWFRNNVQVTLGPSLTVTQAGTYIGKATNSCGSVYDTIVLSTSTPIVYSLGPDTSICPGKSIVLNATTPGPNIQYQWSTGEQTPAITVSQFNNYSVSVTNGLCTKNDTVFVDTIGPPRPIFLGNDTAYCGAFKMLLFTGDNTIWSTGVTSTQITVDKPGTYIAENKNACGIEKDTIILKQYQLPFVNLGKDTTICDSVVLSIRNNNFRSVIWSTNESSNSIIVTESGIYSVTVADSACSFTDSINIHKECLYDVYLPSAFTPNGDAINDVLVPLSPIKGITVLDFSVFDRWGERVYQSSNFPPNDKTHGWNGTYKGENSQQDSYGFYFSIRLPDNQVKTYKGTVSLLR
jgi:gliding motility-associated-like protein